MKNSEHLVKYEEIACSATYQPLEFEELLTDKTYPVVDIDDEVGLNDSRGKVKHERFEENKEHFIKWGKSACSLTDQLRRTVSERNHSIASGQ